MSTPSASTASSSLASPLVPRDVKVLNALPWVLGICGALRLASGAVGFFVIQFQRLILGAFQPVRQVMEPAGGADLFAIFTNLHVVTALVSMWSIISGTVLLLSVRAVSRRSSHTRALIGTILLALPTSESTVGLACTVFGIFAITVLLKPAVRERFAQQSPSTPAPAARAS